MVALTGVVKKEEDRSEKIPMFDKTWNLQNWLTDRSWNRETKEGTGAEKDQKTQKSQEMMVLLKEETPGKQRLQKRTAPRVKDTV